MKRFLVFAYEQYYPRGGWGDFVGDFDTLEEVYAADLGKYTEWAHVVDLTTGEQVGDEVHRMDGEGLWDWANR